MKLPSLEQKIGPLKLWQWLAVAGALAILKHQGIVKLWTPHWGVGGIGGAGIEGIGIGGGAAGIGGYGDGGWGCDEEGYCGGDQGGGQMGHRHGGGY